jgi:hypothetical protein
MGRIIPMIDSATIILLGIGLVSYVSLVGR